MCPDRWDDGVVRQCGDGRAKPERMRDLNQPRFWFWFRFSHPSDLLALDDVYAVWSFAYRSASSALLYGCDADAAREDRSGSGSGTGHRHIRTFAVRRGQWKALAAHQTKDSPSAQPWTGINASSQVVRTT